jgi:hypothetical protein
MYNVEITHAHTAQQRKIIYQINRRLRGSLKDSNVKKSSLIKYGLNELVDNPNIQHVLKQTTQKPPKRAKETKDPVQLKPAPLFNKSDVIDYIKTYTNVNTVKSYMTAYDNTKHRTSATHFPSFDSNDLLQFEFLENLKDNKKFRFFLSPLPSFLKKYIESPGIPELIDRIRAYVKETSVQYLLESVQKSALPLVVSKKELIDTFDMTHAILTDTKKYDIPRDERAKLFNLGILSGLYGHVSAFRDDIGSVVLNDTTANNHMDGNVLYINTYKTSKSYGTSEHIIPDKLMGLINLSIIEFKRIYLIILDIDAPKQLDKLITSLLNYALNKKVTINDIRRTWTTEALASSKNTIETAKNLNHSIQTALLLYRRDAN